MSLLSCPREARVRDAAVAGRWTAELRAHASSCRICADVSLVAQALAAAPGARPRPADPAVLWMHARLARRLHAEAQISRLVTGIQTIIGLAVVAGLAYTGATMNVWSRLPPPAVNGAVACTAGVLLAGVLLIVRRGGRRRGSPA